VTVLIEAKSTVTCH